MTVGEFFEVDVNQGKRDACIIAVDGEHYLYEYEMPNGSSCIRNEKDRPIPYRSLSKRWLDLIEEQYGIINLIAQPQQNGRGNVREELIARLAVPA